MDSDDSIFFSRTHFSGRVQGVGFRYSTLQIAKEFEVTGFVKNLMDGRVELEVEGRESECRQFLDRVNYELGGYIKKSDSSDGRRKRLFDRFAIV